MDLNNKNRQIFTKDLDQLLKQVAHSQQVEIDTVITAQDIEDAVYEKYKNDETNYVNQMLKITTFLDKSTSVGKFSDLYKIKIVKNVYTPERLAVMDISDFLPEIFSNPATTDTDKKAVLVAIEKFIKDLLERHFTVLKDPTARIPTKPEHEISKTYLNDKAGKLSDICYNDYWNIKKADIIICKDSGKFYCLDAQKLVQQIAQTDSASNYYTGNKLPDDIITNLKNRYSDQIAELKAGGEVTLNTFTVKTLTTELPAKLRLARVIQALAATTDMTKKGLQAIDDIVRDIRNKMSYPKIYKPRTLLEKYQITPKVSSYIKETPEEMIKKGITAGLPPMIKDQFNKDDITTAIDTLNSWLKDIIKELEESLRGSQEWESAAEAEAVEPGLSKDIEKLVAEGLAELEAAEAEEAAPEESSLFTDEEEEAEAAASASSAAEPALLKEAAVADWERLRAEAESGAPQTRFQKLTQKYKQSGQMPSVNVDSLQDYIRINILGNDTYSKSIVGEYKNKLEVFRNTILEYIKQAPTPDERAKLNKLLEEVEASIKQLQQSVSTFEGILGLLKGELHVTEKQVESLKEHPGGLFQTLVNSEFLNNRLRDLLDETSYIKNLQEEYQQYLKASK